MRGGGGRGREAGETSTVGGLYPTDSLHPTRRVWVGLDTPAPFHLAARGTSVPLIQQTMKHADIATTLGYIHIRPGDSSALHLPQV